MKLGTAFTMMVLFGSTHGVALAESADRPGRNGATGATGTTAATGATAATTAKSTARKKSAVKSSAKAKKLVNPGKSFSEKDAIGLVEKRPEVKKWLALVRPTTKRKIQAVVEVDRKEGSEYVVHAYELVPDDAETSHTATMNWYYVDFKTGKVRTEF